MKGYIRIADPRLPCIASPILKTRNFLLDKQMCSRIITLLIMKNVEIGLPKLMVDIELETIDREAFAVYLLRKDENGVIDVYVPAMFQLPHKIYVSGTDVMSFSGEINPSLLKTGFFTFQYSDLLNIPVDKKMPDYQWGGQIRSKNNHPVFDTGVVGNVISARAAHQSCRLR